MKKNQYSHMRSQSCDSTREDLGLGFLRMIEPHGVQITFDVLHYTRCFDISHLYRTAQNCNLC